MIAFVLAIPYALFAIGIVIAFKQIQSLKAKYVCVLFPVLAITIVALLVVMKIDSGIDIIDDDVLSWLGSVMSAALLATSLGILVMNAQVLVAALPILGISAFTYGAEMLSRWIAGIVT